MTAFRPSLTEDDRQTLIDVLEYAESQLSDSLNGVANSTQRFALKSTRTKIRALQKKMFPSLYPQQPPKDKSPSGEGSREITL